MAAPVPFSSQQGRDLSREQHFSVGEIAKLWAMSEQKVHDVFEEEPGVVRLGHSASTGRKRRYISLRIPASVAARVHARLCRGESPKVRP